MKLPVLLRIYFNEKLEGVRQFTEGQIVIGRNSEAQVNLQDEGVSPLHAVIEERESGYYVSDLGSQSGVFKNGEKILDEVLNSGDELKIGPYKVQFFIGVPKPAAPPAKKEGASMPQAAPPSPQPKVEPPVVVEPPPRIPEQVPEVQESFEFKKVDTPPILPIKAKPSESSSPRKEAVKTASPKGGVGSKVYPSVPESKKTFAPPSTIKDPKEFLKPGKGTVVEVVVCWKERVLFSDHFNEKQTVTMGSSKACDILVPILSSQTEYSLLRITNNFTVLLSPEMTGELISDQGMTTFGELTRMNRLRNTSGGYELEVSQGEMVRIGLQGDLISIYVRYVPETPKPLVAPLLDLTASEVTGVVLAVVVAAIFGLYMMVYAPTQLEDEDRLEEKLRKATVTFNVPKRKEKVKVEEKVKPVPEKKRVRVVDKVKQSTAPTVAKDGAPGKAGEVAPKPTKDKVKKLTSARPGGAIKTAPKEGASAKSQKPDVSKVGLLSVFGSKGTQSKLDQAYSGAGELTGMADSATGYAGSSEDRAGDMGTKLKDTGAGGKGSATVGISGVGTQGKGTGSYGYGTGGIGKKGNVDINIGGQEAEFTGTIDRDAIRRVVQANKRAIQFCYDKALQRDRDLYGKIVLEWDIAERGRVTRAVVKSNSLGDSQVANCIIERLRTWTFPEPPPDQIAVVAYPFVFSSQ